MESPSPFLRLFQVVGGPLKQAGEGKGSATSGKAVAQPVCLPEVSASHQLPTGKTWGTDTRRPPSVGYEGPFESLEQGTRRVGAEAEKWDAGRGGGDCMTQAVSPGQVTGLSKAHSLRSLKQSQLPSPAPALS